MTIDHIFGKNTIYVWTKEPFLLHEDDKKWVKSYEQEFGIKSNMEPIDTYRLTSNFIDFQNTWQCSIVLVSAVWDRRGSKL